MLFWKRIFNFGFIYWSEKYFSNYSRDYSRPTHKIQEIYSLQCEKAITTTTTTTPPQENHTANKRTIELLNSIQHRRKIITSKWFRKANKKKRNKLKVISNSYSERFDFSICIFMHRFNREKLIPFKFITSGGCVYVYQIHLKFNRCILE